ncbi:MAG: glycosyltransferase [Burkholderiales bacterium]|nr:glycosyltransferase [Burkholderiales bacterium]
MRILHSESSTGWGGQENRTLHEAAQLRRLGVEVYFGCRRGARLAREARALGFAAQELPMASGLDPRGILGLAACMRRHRIDLVNSHSGRDTLLAGIAVRLLPSRPLLVRTRHLALPITSKATYSLLPDHVVCVSEAVRTYLASAGIAPRRLSAVPTGVDIARFDPEKYAPDLRGELDLPGDVPLVGTVAILRMKKGHQDLIAAIPRVLEALPRAHFVFAGDGPQRANIERALREAGLGARVSLLGLRGDVPRVLRGIDLFVLPTHEEALGTSFLEAQAMGVPVIGTRVGGVPEALREGETGLLVPARDPAALAAAIVTLAGDRERLRRMGEAARRFVRAEYSGERMGERMLALYRRLLEDRRR